MSFEQDIKSRDTSLFPIVEIGDDIKISTNSVTLNDTDGNPQYYKPLLLNVPSLKESIDLENRKYKISNVNLDISNFPHEGVRFSEMMQDSSLINKEVNISWVSQSNVPYPIYKGQIRRYSHDDEKVRLVVEDRSQATLHRDLPEEELGVDVAIPSEYQNKPKPMVYGYVDRSPCVISHYLSDTENLEAPIVSMIILADSKKINFIAEGDNISAPESVTEFAPSILNKYPDGRIYIHDGEGKYLRVSHTTNFGGYSKPQLESSSYIESDDGSYVAFDSYHDLHGNATNAFGDNFLEVNCMRFPVGITGYWNSTFDWSLENEVEMLYQGYHIEGDYNTAIDRNISTYFSILSHTSYGTFLFHNQNGLIFEFKLNTLGVEGEQAKTEILLKYTVTNNAVSNEQVRIRAGTNIDQNIGIFNTSAGSETQFNSFENEDFLVDFGSSFPKTNYTTNYIIYEQAMLDERVWSGRFYESALFQQIQMESPQDQKFYANVKGRAMQNNGESPTATQLISYILEEELGVTGIEFEDIYDWKYAFTVDKKINSKKLLENISSASPFIPRFNNMGDFKFDVIKDKYGDDDIENAVKIQESDCIKWSYSKTKIEDVYSKIEFKYKWDYARGDFGVEPIVMDVYDLEQFEIDDTYFEYYGFPVEEDLKHSESTLVIDDDRGKYIRDEGTAKEYTRWMLYWHCNQHLKVKVKLPLKYLEIEIGNLIAFDKVLGDVKPYGINYATEYPKLATFTLDTDEEEVEYLGDFVNFSQAYPLFMCISTNKTLEYIELECIQLHKLSDEE